MPQPRIYKISQNTNSGFGTRLGVYSDAVVAAFGIGEAREIHPDGRSKWKQVPEYELQVDEQPRMGWVAGEYETEDTWASTPKDVKVEIVGYASREAKIYPGQVICASYHAG